MHDIIDGIDKVTLMEGKVVEKLTTKVQDAAYHGARGETKATAHRARFIETLGICSCRLTHQCFPLSRETSFDEFMQEFVCYPLLR